jgi:hypothetical protein
MQTKFLFIFSDMLEKLYERFTCPICTKTMKCPAICRNCGLLVGCESCNKTLTETATFHEEYPQIEVKKKGEWKCPYCRFPPFRYDQEWTAATLDVRSPNFIGITIFDFLPNLAKWAEVNKKGE